MDKRQLPGLNPSIAYQVGSFEEWGVRNHRVDFSNLKNEDYYWLRDAYEAEFHKHMNKMKRIDEDSFSAVQLVIRSAVAHTQSSASYIGDVYNVELPDSMKWYASMTGRGIFTSYAWATEDSVLPVLMEKYATSSYAPYEPWRSEEIWRIVGDEWELTFGGSNSTWGSVDETNSQWCVTMLSIDDSGYYRDPYYQMKHRIYTAVSPRLLGDEEAFLNDLCLLKLL